MKTLLINIRFFLAVSQGCAEPIVLKDRWLKENLSADERDELVERSKKESFHSIAPILVKELQFGAPLAYTALLEDEPWKRRPRLCRAGR